MITTNTFMAKKEEVRHGWFVVDAEDAILGRMAVKIATVLMGKHKPEYTQHVDTGDFVIVVNAQKIRLTGNKMKDKIYYFSTGYIGGIKKRPFEWMMKKYAERVVMLAVRRMLPKSKLGTAMLAKLKIYTGPKHPHDAQRPSVLAV